jgi:hypothetical protein
MVKLDPRTPGFNNIKNLINRINANRKTEPDSVVSIEDADVPSWQRQVVWTDSEMGLLIYSIIRSYPIGAIFLWKKPNKMRVPIDGRQRITAIKMFYEGQIAIPDLPIVDAAYKNKKYKLLPGDEDKGFSQLSPTDIDNVDDYSLQCWEYDGISEKTAMSVFVMLQGGKSLTKTEVRAALGGRLCDFITELTLKEHVINEEEDEETQELPKNLFFKALAENLSNRRKAHRNVADVLLHEYLYPDKDKHWSSLQAMYQDKSDTLTQSEKAAFKIFLNKFHKETTIKAGGKKVLMPQLRTAYFILTVFKAFRTIKEDYTTPKGFKFSDAIRSFETERVKRKKEQPFVSFTAALSNAGYAQNRIHERHDILMGYIFKNYPNVKAKRKGGKRLFTIEQKVAIWEIAKGRCQENGCKEKFAHPREADADHVVMWKDGGETTIENGRLLCQTHNRGRKV